VARVVIIDLGLGQHGPLFSLTARIHYYTNTFEQIKQEWIN